MAGVDISDASLLCIPPLTRSCLKGGSDHEVTFIPTFHRNVENKKQIPEFLPECENDVPVGREHLNWLLI